MNLVRQESARDCGVACLMMLTGHSRERVTAYFGRSDFGTRGLYRRGLEDYLVDAGYALAPKSKYMGWFASDEGGNVERKPWPPSPFAERHLCEVEVHEHAPCFHFVVMRLNGEILDPLCDQPKKYADYFRILSVTAVVSHGG